MHTSTDARTTGLALFLLAALPAAQAGPLGESVDLAGDASVSRDPQGLVAVGPDYLARFGGGGVEFLPTRGAAAVGDGTLVLHLESITRGSEVLIEAAAASPAQGERLVEYRRAEGVVERYEAREDGLYQSLVFPVRPAGTGDLVARFAVETELVPTAVGGELEFLAPDGTGARLGAVVGIDAEGARADGRARLVDGGFELVLPSAFVDRASYPLVFDPLLGTIADLTASIFGTPPDTRPAVAYDAGTDEYLVAWQRQNDVLTSSILARRVDGSTGAPVGATIAVRTASNVQATEPAVACVASLGRFVVVWQDAGPGGAGAQILAAAVDAGTGSVSGALAVAPSGNEQLVPDVGGQRDAGSDGVVVVWDEAGVGVRTRPLVVPAVGVPAPSGSSTTLASENLLSFPGAPAIAQSSGPAGRFLVTWTNSTLVDATIEGRVLDRFGVPLVATNTPLSPATEPRPVGRSDVDGDGESWAVVWETYQNAASTTLDEVTARRVTWSGSGFAFDDPSAVATSNTGGPSPIPRYAYCGDDLGVYLDRFFGSFDLPQVGQLYQPWTAGCITEPVFFLSGETQGLDVASTWSGGGNELDQTVLLAWDRAPLGGGDARIEVQRYRTTTNGFLLGGGCGNVGELQLPCHYEGSTTFRPRLRDTTFGGQGILAFNTLVAGGLPCGPCDLLPAANGGLQLVPTGLIDLSGFHSVALPIPPQTAGITVIFQWLVVNPAPVDLCPNFPALSLSDAKSVTILALP